MITFEELEMFVEIGRNYNVICKDFSVNGNILKLGEQSIVLEKENGKKQLISNSSIISIDEDTKSSSEKKNMPKTENITTAYNNLPEDMFDNYSKTFSQSKNGIGLSPFQKYFLDSIDIDQCNRDYFDGKLAVVESHYKGKSYDAKNDIEKLELISKHYGSEERCEIMLLMARLAYDSISNSNDGCFSEDNIYSLLGRYFVHLADFFLSESKSDDAAKCYYVEALKLLPAADDKFVNRAINMLSYLFFVDSTELSNEMVSEEIEKKKNIGKYFGNAKQAQNNIREFLITLFLFKEEKDVYYNLFIDEINLYPEFKSYIKDECSVILSKNSSEIEEELEDLLKDTFDYCKDKLQQLEDLLINTTKELELSDKLKDRINSIKDFRNLKLLLANDDDYLSSYVGELRDLVEAIEETNVDEEVEDYCKIVEGTEDNIDDLKKAPTLWGFTLLKYVNTVLHHKIKNKVNLIFKDKRPRITNISLTEKSNCFYIKDRTISVEIGIDNEEGSLTADGIEIFVTSEDELKTKIDNRINSIEGGTLASRIVKFKLSDEVIKRGSLKFKVICVYKFRLDFENNTTSDRIEQEFWININNEKSFVEIENMYDKVLNGSGCATCPEMFKGRTKLINRLCNSMRLGNGLMNKNRGIVLWGQRRVGKNSVKDSFKKELELRYPGAYIHIDIGSTGICEESFENLLSKIARDTERKLRVLAKDAEKLLESNEVLPDSERGMQLRDYIKIYDAYKSNGLEKAYKNIQTSETYILEFNDYLKDVVEIITDISGNNRNILLFYIDEFTYFYQWIKEGKVDGRIFMQFIKSFISDNGICAVLLAQDNMPVWKDEYSNEFNCMDFDNMITYLDYDGAKELICEPCPIDGESRFSDDAIQYIYDITKGSAYLIDILCGQIIDYLNKNHVERVSKNIVEIVLMEWIDGEKDFFPLSTFESQYEDTSKVGDEAKRIRENNLTLLYELALKSKDGADIAIDTVDYLKNGKTEDAQHVFDLLEDRKIIEVVGEACKISMPLLTFSLLKEHGQMDKHCLNYFAD